MRAIKQAFSKESYIQVLSYNPPTPDAYFNVASILRVVRFSKYKQEFDSVILEILNKGTYVRPSEICPAVISLLREKPVIKSHGGTDFIGFANSLDVCNRIVKGNLIEKIKQNL